ncbi:MAG: F0F1 ATP synthase subunit epsilon [Lachnospiraceae bacterium]|nr:F0F1 ATP synthase subunit epsilon [Lachnospiraceae bacterium]
MNYFNLHIHTAERDFYNGPCSSLIIPVEDGQYGIKAHHRNMIAAIVPGEMEMTVPLADGDTSSDPEKVYAVLSAGIVKIEDNDVLILADTALTYDELDESEAKMNAQFEKEKRLQKRSTKEYLEAEVEMRRAIYKLKKRKDKSFES